MAVMGRTWVLSSHVGETQVGITHKLGVYGVVSVRKPSLVMHLNNLSIHVIHFLPFVYLQKFYIAHIYKNLFLHVSRTIAIVRKTEIITNLFTFF